MDHRRDQPACRRRQPAAPSPAGRLLACLLALGAVLGGCGRPAATTCLQTPVSGKLAANAVASCEEALAAQPERQDLFLHTVELLRVQQRYGEIVSWSRRALVQDPQRSEALFYLAYGLRKSGRCAEALGQYRAYAAANPKDPDPYFGLALCYKQLGQREEAVAAFQTYLGREQRASQAAWVRQAQEQLAALGQAAPASGAAAGPAAAGRAKPGAAALQVQAASAADPSQAKAEASSREAQPSSGPSPAAQSDPGRSQAADCSAAEQAIRADPFDTAAYDHYASCASERGQHEELVRRMRVGLRDNPDYHRGWLHLGRALQALGQATQAKSALARACSLGISEACGL